MVKLGGKIAKTDAEKVEKLTAKIDKKRNN